jgi:zinc transport system ATP-binding protein
MTAGSTIATLTRACVEFEGEHVLEDVDLAIKPGEFIALLGPNGSGKTTLVRAMLGLQDLDHGKVTLFDQRLDRFRQWWRVALVPQRLPGASSIPVSVWETVLSGRISPRQRWHPFSKVARASAEQALREVGLYDRRHDRLDELSGGQQRRVMIARALASEAELLVMDEPTAGLDAENVAALVLLLEKIKVRGSTVLVVTHDLAGIERLVTRAIVLAPNRERSVVFDGPPPVPVQLADSVHHHTDDDFDPPPVLELEA